MSKFSTGICQHCGADSGLHQFETMRCPKNGREENRFDKLTGKYYPQQWENTCFADQGDYKLFVAAPELLEALIHAKKVIRLHHGMGMNEPEEKMMWAIYDKNSPEMRVINNALQLAGQKV
jgi:hypothetical protein